LGTQRRIHAAMCRLHNLGCHPHTPTSDHFEHVLREPNVEADYLTKLSKPGIYLLVHPIRLMLAHGYLVHFDGSYHKHGSASACFMWGVYRVAKMMSIPKLQIDLDK
jgi:hypothetical protein